MRRDATPAERKLWNALRNSRLNVGKFRRQVPIGRYIADFYCTEAKLAVEVDGVTHAVPKDDAARTAWLNTQGIHVIRFLNSEVIENVDGVIWVVAETIRNRMKHQC